MGAGSSTAKKSKPTSKGTATKTPSQAALRLRRAAAAALDDEKLVGFASVPATTPTHDAVLGSLTDDVGLCIPCEETTCRQWHDNVAGPFQ